jgi:hypothetical protein
MWCIISSGRDSIPDLGFILSRLGLPRNALRLGVNNIKDETIRNRTYQNLFRQQRARSRLVA